jgi:hypothetical protein
MRRFADVGGTRQLRQYRSFNEAGLGRKISAGKLPQQALFANAIGVAPRPRTFNRCGGGENVAVGVAPACKMHADRKAVA